MRITKVKLTLGYTYNLGDYSNIRPEVSLTADIHDTDNVIDCLEHLYDTARLHCHRVIDDAHDE